jgi:hypothetical protein
MGARSTCCGWDEPRGGSEIGADRLVESLGHKVIAGSVGMDGVAHQVGTPEDALEDVRDEDGARRPRHLLIAFRKAPIPEGHFDAPHDHESSCGLDPGDDGL